MKELQGKLAVVTGAASGIGRALAVNLANEGCNLALSDVNEQGLAETQTLCTSDVEIATHIVNVADKDAVYQYAETIKHEHGGASIIFNNAGVAARQTVEDIDYEDFEWVINTNMWGVVYFTKAFLPQLRDQPDAHIVNISSINAMIPFPRNAPYNMAKYAVLAFSETLIQELESTSIRVSSVHPGGIKTSIASNSRHVSDKAADSFNKIAMTSPDKAAKIMIKGVKRNKEKIFVGQDAQFMQLLKRAFPQMAIHLPNKLMKNTLDGS